MYDKENKKRGVEGYWENEDSFFLVGEDFGKGRV